MTDKWITITPENYGQWRDTNGNPTPIGTRLRHTTVEAGRLRGLVLMCEECKHPLDPQDPQQPGYCTHCRFYPSMQDTYLEWVSAPEPRCAGGPASYIGCGTCPERHKCAWVTKP